ncbi:hypothetical protein CSKR_108032 [Clonorchis sinensis]|uniref:Uncharacterized protein n=1 Tax=Clonorchis sinensis TaxID=79923 RepID=A0A419Q6A8_CLOSI|nr:hypothetical protein CSKR_108032 [Clonorchis sinensis]
MEDSLCHNLKSSKKSRKRRNNKRCGAVVRNNTVPVVPEENFMAPDEKMDTLTACSSSQSVENTPATVRRRNGFHNENGLSGFKITSSKASNYADGTFAECSTCTNRGHWNSAPYELSVAHSLQNLSKAKNEENLGSRTHSVVSAPNSKCLKENLATVISFIKGRTLANKISQHRLSKYAISDALIMTANSDLALVSAGWRARQS